MFCCLWVNQPLIAEPVLCWLTRDYTCKFCTAAINSVWQSSTSDKVMLWRLPWWIKTVFSDINLHHRHWLSQPGASGPINVTLIAGPLRLSLPICLGIVWNSYGLAFRVSKWKLLWQIRFDIWSNPVSQWQRTVGVWSLLTKQGVSEEEDLHFTTFTTKFWFSLFCTLKIF